MGMYVIDKEGNNVKMETLRSKRHNEIGWEFYIGAIPQ